MATDNKTDRTDVPAVPLYQQVMDDLKGEIARGVYAAGSRIPSEMELAKSYGVGRITVRRAIEELSRAGYLNRQQGRAPLCALPSSNADSPEGRRPEFHRGLCRQRHGGRSAPGVAHGGCGDA